MGTKVTGNIDLCTDSYCMRIGVAIYILPIEGSDLLKDGTIKGEWNIAACRVDIGANPNFIVSQYITPCKCM